MNIAAEKSYPTPLSNSTLLPLLLLSLARQRHTPHSSTTIDDEYDYIIVGGGAGGSVVASRLSEESNVNVLLLEAGHEPPLLTEVPSLNRYFLGSDVSWNFTTVPQKYSASGRKNRQIIIPFGKMLGGSGSHNGMAYVRGNRKDYDNWASQGAKGWSYKEIFPYFLKLEDNKDIAFLANGYHAVGGPVTVHRPRFQSELKQAIWNGATQLGFQFVDSNAGKQTGFYDFQSNLRDNQRCSTVKAYLVPAENRTNLDILLNAMVTKVIIAEGRASGVEFCFEGQFHTVKAKREVIISAGTVNTPKLLMLSGVGPRDELQKFGIPVIADLPVGKNFHDHAAVNYLFTVDPRFRFVDDTISDPSNILQYINSRSGPLASTDSLSIAFVNGFHSDDLPDYEMYFQELPKSFVDNTGFSPMVYQKYIEPYENRTLLTCVVQQLRPKSRGTVTLMSRNPFDPPTIDPNHLKNSEDVDIFVIGLKTCRDMLNTTPLLKVGARPLQTLVPGCEKYAAFDDEYFRCMARTILTSFYHSVGTSKMGDPVDHSTVVDPELRVKFIEGLRVVDASVMPQVTSGNTYIPTVMIAEKASDMIKTSLYAQI